ncbi:MAG: PIN domain-containing protein, partial [Spirochaetota bacterium]
YARTKDRLSKLPFLNTNKETYLYASSLYRALRSKGITIPSVDATIAAISILNKIPLFTKDKHFKTIAKQLKLMLYDI